LEECEIKFGISLLPNASGLRSIYRKLRISQILRLNYSFWDYAALSAEYNGKNY